MTTRMEEVIIQEDSQASQGSQVKNLDMTRTKDNFVYQVISRTEKLLQRDLVTTGSFQDILDGKPNNS